MSPHVHHNLVPTLLTARLVINKLGIHLDQEDVNASSGLLLRAGQDDDFLLQRHCQVFYTGPEPAMNDKLTLNSEPDHSILPN